MKKSTIVIVIAIVALAGLMGLKLMNNKKEIDSRKEAKAVNRSIAVTVAQAEMRASDNRLELVGTAEANQEVTVATEMAGKITSVNFRLGDYVSKGAVLASVDDTYKKLALDNARLNYDKYKEDLMRYQKLHQGDAVSETQLRDMQIGFENAEIQLEQATKQFQDCRIIAPFSGYITSRNVDLGAYVAVAASIAGLADISQLRVSLSVTESIVYNLKIGQPVEVKASVYPDATFPGKVSHISPKGDKAHCYPVEIVVANSQKQPLKAGTYVNVYIDLGESVPMLMIPRDAIVSSVKDPSVYLVENGTAKLVKITMGKDYGSYLSVTDGLKEGDQVATSGQINLMDGAQVSIINN